LLFVQRDHCLAQIRVTVKRSVEIPTLLSPTLDGLDETYVDMSEVLDELGAFRLELIVVDAARQLYDLVNDVKSRPVNGVHLELRLVILVDAAHVLLHLVQ